MSKKCAGCGSVLQNNDNNIEGYVNELEIERIAFCERCFRIKNYGDYKHVVKDNNTFIKILDEINKGNDLVLLVVDLFNLPEDFDLITDHISNPILMVLTKRDVLPKSVYEDRLMNYMDKFNIKCADKIIVSSNKNYNFDRLMKKIEYYKNSDRVYVVGYTNAGKSTLINKLMYNYSDYISSITTSIMPSTTLNSIEIKFDKNLTLIDTPGLLNDNSLENMVDVATLKKMNPKKNIRPITYQVKAKQYIVIPDLLKVVSVDNDLTFYISNDLPIDRFFRDRDMPNLEKQIIDVDFNEDIVITGLGFIKSMKREKIEIHTLKDVKVYTRKSFI